jgi:PAS domain-containing protein
MEHLSLDLPAKVFWMKMSYFGITAMPIAWLVFTLQYTNREKWLTRRNLAILIILPVITLVIVWTNNIHHLIWKDIWLDTSLSSPVDAVTHNTWFWVYATYAYSLLLLGTLCLLGLFRQSSGIYRKQAGTLLLAAFMPWAGNILFIAGIRPFSLVDPTPLAFAVTGVAFFWGLSRLQLLDIMPIAHEAILRSMVDGVIVLDTRQRIIELNPAAEHIIDRKRAEVIGQPYNRVLPGQAGLLELNPLLCYLGNDTAPPRQLSITLKGDQNVNRKGFESRPSRQYLYNSK